MNANKSVDFCWDDLLHYIAMRNVIPVTGEGLYWVQHKEGNPPGHFLLYPFLAKKFIEEMKLEPQPSNETFAQAVFRYEEKFPHKDINMDVQKFLAQQLEALVPVPNQALWQLARIKTLGLFINTTYDNYLQRTLKQVRSHGVETIHYTLNRKWSTKPDAELFNKLEAGECSVVFNIYGNAAKSMAPAYTEKDILETIVSFQKDMEIDRRNLFFQTLERSNLLFMGCRYDDWLFRFFIRTMSNKPYLNQPKPNDRQFIGDDFASFRCGDLQRFLKAHGTEVFISPGNVELPAALFGKIAANPGKYPDSIIPETEFPAPAFISFHGADRAAAESLVKHLQADGINVWLDKSDLPAGERVDERIAQAIAARPVFIALVSENTRQLQPETGNAVRYHIREWEWGYGQYCKNQNPKHIMPVVIDETAWMYDSFKPFTYLKIKGGERVGDYEKLRNRLMDILEKWER